uniref:Uncharacterized protein n=1 Tax=Pediastrum duplex TaxID=3105 RepID=A0A1W5RMN4_PEDDU|nr:hypothetical protein [Pediastrum duplex]AQU64461.1 hypothetical protein [Pediastrum duplex]
MHFISSAFRFFASSTSAFTSLHLLLRHPLLHIFSFADTLARTKAIRKPSLLSLLSLLSLQRSLPLLRAASFASAKLIRRKPSGRLFASQTEAKEAKARKKQKKEADERSKRTNTLAQLK